jgi:pimeloyl-ACP methyl ester carboxylesterase
LNGQSFQKLTVTSDNKETSMADFVPERTIWQHLHKTAFTQDWVNVNGVNTRYVQAGPKDGLPVVFIHGTAGTWECFCANLESHAKHFNCLAMDMVGSGFSDKPDLDYEIPFYADHIRGFMAAMGIGKASLVGVSLGAWVASRLAIEHPELVRTLTLLAASGVVVNKETMGGIRSMRTKAVDEPTWDNIRNVFTSLIHEEHNRIQDLVFIRQAVYRQPDMKKAMNHILCLQDPEIRARNTIATEDWKRIAAPTLIITAPDDKEDYYQTSLTVAKLIPNARTFEIRGVKHWANFEKPEVFNPVSLDFLLRNTAARAA